MWERDLCFIIQEQWRKGYRLVHLIQAITLVFTLTSLCSSSAPSDNCMLGKVGTWDMCTLGRLSML